MKHIPGTVWRLMIAYSLMMAGTSLMVLLAGIIGTEIAPSVDLATLPLALIVVGVAASTLPTGKLLHRFGRRRVFIAYGLVAISCSFTRLAEPGFGDFYRFLPGRPDDGLVRRRRPPVPVCGTGGRTGRDRTQGNFVSPAGRNPGRFYRSGTGGAGQGTAGHGICRIVPAAEPELPAGIIIISFNPDIKIEQAEHHGSGRPLSEILRSPVIILAISAAALGYGIMSFIMTATPISMHNHSGHSLEATKFVIQSHIVAMYSTRPGFSLVVQQTRLPRHDVGRRCHLPGLPGYRGAEYGIF